MSEISITDPKFETRGTYGDGYEINLSAYEGIDTSRLAVVFSGQGSARPGMFLEEYQRLPAMKQHFAIADKMAADRGLPAISSFILDAAKLQGETLCKVRNLAIFTAQIACYEAIIEAGLRPIVVSGFSQGEVAALVASGIASFTDGFKILYERDRVSSPPNSLGYMMAVAASPDRLQQILDPKTYFVSCIGAPEQITISIRPEHVDQVTKILKQHDILLKLLDIPQPYHTELMRPVSDQIHSFLQSGQIRFKTPALPMVSCISHRVIDAHNCRNTDWVEIMSRQTTEKVDFVRQIQIIRSFRCGSFLEIGPGRSLQNFIAATLKQHPHRIIELSKVLLPRTEKNNTTKEMAFASNPLLKILQRAIAKVTGYQIERISLEDRFQEDLGVDSLKTAEIILQVMKESGRNLDPARSISGFKDVHSAVEMLENAPLASYDLKPVYTARFLRGRTVWHACPLEQQPPIVFAAQASLTIEFQQIVAQTVSPAELAGKIAAMPARPLLVIRADKPELPFQKALLPTDTRGFLEQTARIIEFFQKILQILPEPNFDLFLVTSQQSGPHEMALPGLLWCLRREFPGLFCKHIYLGLETSESQLETIVRCERNDPFQPLVRYDPERQIAVVEAFSEKVRHVIPRVIVAFGGARGITFALLERIAKKGTHLFIAGRSPTRDSTVAGNLAILRQKGAQVNYTVLDATDATAVRRLLENVRQRRRRIDLVINGTGLEVSRSLLHKSARDIRAELGGKLEPALHIFNARQKLCPGQLVQFSSIVGRLGNPGQTVYAYANALINELCASTEKCSDAKVLAINWPPWEGIGMTANLAILDGLHRRGLSTLDADQAAELFAADLSAVTSGVVDYFDPDDQPVYEIPLKRCELFRPLIGIPGSGKSFRKEFSISSDMFLHDHCLDGQALVPAATGICMALCFALLHDSTFNSIKSLQIVNPMIVGNDGLSVDLEVLDKHENLNNKPFVVGIRSAVQHLTAQVCRVAAAEKPASPGLKIDGPDYSIKDLYQNKFFHGPVFQVLHRAFLGSNGSICTEVVAEQLLPVTGLLSVDRLTQALDAAFQTVALNVYEKTGQMAIPVATGQIVFSDLFCQYKRLVLVPDACLLEGDSPTANLTAMDEKGNIYLAIEGIRLRKIYLT